MRARLKSILQEFHQPSEQREDSMARLFHEQSKLAPHRRTELGERIGQLQSGGLVGKMVNAYKSYPAMPQFELPRAHLVLERPLQEVIIGRRSTRNFDTKRAVTQQELANILQLSYGITGQLDVGGG